MKPQVVNALNIMLTLGVLRMQPNITFVTHACSLLRCHRSYIVRYVEEKK